MIMKRVFGTMIQTLSGTPAGSPVRRKRPAAVFLYVSRGGAQADGPGAGQRLTVRINEPALAAEARVEREVGGHCGHVAFRANQAVGVQTRQRENVARPAGHKRFAAIVV